MDKPASPNDRSALPAHLRHAAHRLSDLGGTLAALESGLFSDAASGDETLLDYCAGLRLVKDGLGLVKAEIDALADGLAA